MSIFNIAYYTVLRYTRDKHTLLNMVMLPIVLILILGTALGPSFTVGNIGKTSVGYLNLDKEAASLPFEEFLNNDEIKDMFDITKVSTKQEALDLITKGKIVSLIFIDKGYTSKIQKGEKAEIEVTSNENSSFRKSVVENIIESYLHGANGIQAVINIGGQFDGQFERSSGIENKSISATERLPRAMDYYGVTMLVMTLMYGAAYGVSGMGEDFFRSIGGRLKVTPIKLYQIYIGKVLGVVATLFLQALILIGFTKFVYGVNWGDNIFAIFFICLSLAILSTGIGVMLCTVSKDMTTASNIVSIIVPIFTFLSGGYFPVDNMSGLITKLRYLSPNYLTQTAIFNQVYGGSVNQTTLMIGGLWIIIAATFGISLAAGRRSVN